MNLNGFKRVVFAAVAAMGSYAWADAELVQFGTGGVVSQVGQDFVHVFESSGTFTVTKAIKARLLVVGGGGAGGVTIGAGGGGGQAIEQDVILEPGEYTVTVGKGGKFPAEADNPDWAKSQNNWVYGPDGEDSSFVLGDVTITAEGGGGGGGWDNQGRNYMKGRPGGCGGGATNDSKEPGEGTVVGANGGKSYRESPGGGGGASGEAGGDGTNTGPAGNGGAGFLSKITGKELDYGSGGGGGAGNTCTAPGAAGGSGAGAGGAKIPTSERGGYGLDGRGGGGGGGGYSPACAGGNGGDGCVIVRYSGIDSDAVLTVASSCEDVGTPNPGYGIKGELKDGDALTCTMAETVVQSADGKTRWTLVGWALYSVDTVNETETLIRSSETDALAGETQSCCLYEHEGCAKLVWNWNKRTALSLANASAQPTSRNAFTVAADVTSTGFVDGQQVDVYAAWGVDPENLIHTNFISTVTEVGPVSLDVTQDVVPGTVHYVQVFAVADDVMAVAAEGTVRIALPSASTGTLPAGYQQVEYLESDTSQCIDTGIKAEGDAVYDGDLEIDITFTTKSYKHQTAVIGGGIWNNYQYLIAIQNNNIQFYGYASPTIPFAANTTYRFVTTADGKWAQFYDAEGNLLGQDSRTDNLKGGKLYIFADGGSYKSAIRVMSCKLWKGGKLVRDFVPAVRIENGQRGQAGFYNVAEDLAAADEVRFYTDPSGNNFAVGADIVDTGHSLLVEGMPENFGKPSPDYGTVANLLAGDTFECWCPETAPSGAGFASCLGWSLQTNRSDDASQWVEAESGTSNRMTYVHPADSGARLVWRWGVKYDVTVSATAGGSAAFSTGGTSASAEPGATLRLEATTNDGYSFAYWTGDHLPAAQVLDNPLDLTVVGNGSLTAHFQSGRVAAWKGGTSTLASDDANWNDGEKPASGDAVVLSSASAGDIVWDLADVEPGSWTQLEGFDRTVTFATTFADSAEDFPVFRVTGDVVLEDGVWTHLENPAAEEKGQAVYRLKADIGGSLTVGEKARIDANGKGLPGGSGYGYVDLGQNGRQGGSYGGRGRNSTMPCYGSVKNPVDVGAGGTPGNRSTTRGGGCIILSVAGAAHVDGVLSANGGMSTVSSDSAKNNATSGGTVSLTAATIDGSGVISADGGAIYDDHSEANMGKYATSSPAGGGRVALIQKGTGATYDGLPENVSAYASFVFEPKGDGTYTRMAPEGGNILSGAGTVYLEVPSDNGRGKLIVRNPYEGGLSYDAFLLTEFGGEAMDDDLDFSAIEIGVGGSVRILPGCGMTNLTETVVSGCGRLIVETDLKLNPVWDWNGLTLYPQSDCNIYGSERTTFGGGVEFCTASHAPGDIVLLSGAKVTQRVGGNDENGYRIDLTMDGDLDLQSGAIVDVTGMGYPIQTGMNFGPGKGIDAYGMNFGPSHGGSGAHASYAEGDYPKPYGSIFCPTNYGAASYYEPGGGRVKIVVKGAATVNGSIVADGGPNPNGYCSGAGGSVWITAAEMSGTGAITANGGEMHHGSPGGAGGRISLMLTKKDADFSQLTGPVTAFACSNIGGYAEMRNCGTVYRQTGNQKFGYGEILVANAANSVNAGLPMTLPFEEGMDAKELKNATLNLGMLAGVELEQDLKIGNLVISDDATLLDLANHNLKVYAPYHAYPSDRVANAGEWIDGKKPGYTNIKWGTPGMAIVVR